MNDSIRSIILISVCLATSLLAGCHGAASRNDADQIHSGAAPPNMRDRLESFSFSSLSGEPLAWDQAQGIVDIGAESLQPRALILHVFQPDCPKCQALARALQRVTKEDHPTNPVAVGIAHRGDEQATTEFVGGTGASYPIAVGTGSRWAHAWGRGDPLYVVNRAGQIVYSQVGFEDGDPDVWRMVLADLAADREVRFTHPERKGLKAGDTLPTLRLTELFENKEITLSSSDDAMVFTDGSGRERRYRTSLGFFSRY